MVMKKLVTAAFYFIFLLSVTTSQLSLLLIMGRHGDAQLRVDWLLAVFFILIIPECIFCIKCIWKASFITNNSFRCWPSVEKLFIKLLLSVLEGMTEVYMVIIVFPKIYEYLLPSILNLYLLPEIITLKSKGESKHKCRYVFINLFCSFALMGCVTAVVIFHASLGQLSLPEAFLSNILIICLGIPQFSPLKRFLSTKEIRGTHNVSVFASFTKLLAITISFMVITSHERNTNFTAVFQNMNSVVTTDVPCRNNFVIIVTINIVCSYISQTLNNIKYENKNKVIPLVVICVSQLMASFICILFYFVKTPFTRMNVDHPDRKPESSEAAIYVLSCMSALVPVILVVLTKLMAVSNSEHAFSESDSNFAYSGIFLSQNVCINKKLLQVKKNPCNQYILNRRRKKTRVFICTTMYQEADYEIKRLLISLKKVLFSQTFAYENISFESHIFMDNGAKKNDLTDFGKQLLESVDDIFDFPSESGLLIYTPYGIQLTWTVENTPLIFIHLKDSSKVKAKKRWSQIMYMKYIIEFKSKNPDSNIYYQNNARSGSFLENSYAQKEKVYHIPRFTKSLPNIVICSAENNYLSKDEDSKSVIDSGLEEPASENSDVDNEQESYTSEKANVHVKDFHRLEIPTELHSMEHTLSIASISTSMDTFFVPEKVDEYILMTDADMSFSESEILNLINTCQKNEELGGVCGRTYPIGQKVHPIVWLQMFDYAKDFWMVKSFQNMIGSVMCCPGCFSLFRFEALKDVFQAYSEPTSSIEDVFTKDNGEDRWMCTLMMLKGWRMQFAQEARNSTFCPEDTEEFMKQRRRWLLSDFANAYVVVKNLRNLMRQNVRFTVFNTLCLLQLFFMMVLYPGSTVIFLSLGLELISGIPFVACASVLSLCIVGYCCLLVSKTTTHAQIVVSKILTIVLGLFTIYVFVMFTIYIIENCAEDYKNKSWTFVEDIMLLSLAATYLLAAFLNPLDSYILLYGIAYLYYLPFLNILLPCYAICNIVDQSWGTRDKQVAKFKNVFRLPKIYLGKRRKSNASHTISVSRSWASLSASSLHLNEHDQDELSFWANTVETLIGVDAPQGLEPKERMRGLRILRKKAILIFLSANGVWIALFCLGFYLFVFFVKEKDLFSVIVLSCLSLTPVTQTFGMLLFKVKNFWEMLNRIIL